VKRDYVAWAGIAVLLLVVGLLAGGQYRPSQAEQMDVFREWFWQSRGVDLAAQVGLIFVGALGIAALLPRDEPEEE